eukprot:UN09916
MEEAAHLLEQNKALLPNTEGLNIAGQLAHQSKPALPPADHDKVHDTTTSHYSSSHNNNNNNNNNNGNNNNNNNHNNSPSSKPKSYMHLLGLKYDGKSFLIKNALQIFFTSCSSWSNSNNLFFTINIFFIIIIFNDEY